MFRFVSVSPVCVCVFDSIFQLTDQPPLLLFSCSAQLAVTTLVTLAMGQNYHQDPKTAAIISEQRYLSGDGKFGAAYTQEDGINFKEETDADGTRHGSYSYVDPSGERRTISYTAGKNG